MKTHASRWLAVGSFLLIYIAFVSFGEKKIHPDDRPVSYWLNDPDPCVRLSAAAIIASGRPYPNEVRDAQHKLVRYDVWIADQLYELSGKGRFLRENVGSSGKRNPWKYMEVAGTIPEMLDIPSPSFKDSRVSAAMSGTVHCEIGRPPSERAEARQMFASTRAELVQMTLQTRNDSGHISKPELRERPEINMTEIVIELKTGGRVGSYIPYALMTQEIDGKVAHKKIVCPGVPSSATSPYEPDAKFDLHRSCYSWIYLRPGVVLEFDVPQQYLPFVPALHDHLIKTLAQSRIK